jgi:hypothetical protein
MKNEYVLPLIAGNLLMIVLTNGLWILVIVAWGVYKIITKNEEQKELNNKYKDNRYTVTEDDSYTKWENGIVVDAESSNGQETQEPDDLKSHKGRVNYMKICPNCEKIYPDQTNKYCGDCGTYLISKREYDRKKMDTVTSGGNKFDVINSVINSIVDDLETECKITCEVTSCTFTHSGESDEFENKLKIRNAYENGKISLEEKAKRLTDLFASKREESFSLYHKYPDIINLSNIYNEKNMHLTVAKIILVFQNINKNNLDYIFSKYNIEVTKEYLFDEFVFYEFIYELEQKFFVVNGEKWYPKDSYLQGISIPRFNAIISNTPLSPIFGSTNYQLSDELYRLPYELFMCLNNGDIIHSLAIRDTLRNLEGIQPKYYEDLNYTLRSSWEANMARILNYLGLKWEYEKTTLVLSGKNEKEPIFYIPDFFLENNDIIEIKGFWDKYSLEKVHGCKHKNFIYPPNIKNLNQEFIDSHYYIIDFDMFHTLEKLYAPLIPNWETMSGLQKSQDIFIVGINRPERTKFVKALNKSDRIILQRDIENDFDKYAIKALNTNGDMLGFVSKEWVCIYADKLDMGMEFEATIKTINSAHIVATVKRTNNDIDILYDFLKPKQ